MTADSFHHSSTASSRSDANEMDRCEFATAPHGPSYRNLFGPANPCERYQGAGSKAKTSAMLLRLAKSMRRAGIFTESNIPAGYTYLAQFTAHDLVHNPTRIPNLFDELQARHDLREQRLMLETLYGGGPTACPHIFHRESSTGNIGRSRLRLLYVYDEEEGLLEIRCPIRKLLENGTSCKQIKTRETIADMRTGKHEQRGAYRDLPRLALDDGPAGAHPLLSYGDTLIADPRNDEHLIIAQLTVVFALLHNVFEQHLRKEDGWKPGRSSRLHYLRASKATTYVYRRIVFQDLLKKLLHPDIFRVYESGFRLEKSADTRMNVEFAHAVFRAGHSMVRFGYKLNQAEETSIDNLILRSGAAPIGNVPHEKNWLIAWSQFFDMTNANPAQRAAQMSPSIEEVLTDHAAFKQDILQPDGLMHADLLRGALSGVRSVKSLAVNIERRMTAKGFKSPKYFLRQTWKSELQHWLKSKEKSSGNGYLTVDDITCLLEDPPLLLVVMLEAEHNKDGSAFGQLGSAVVAETFYSAKDRTRAFIEDDAATQQLVADVFVGEQSCGTEPSDMPSLIDNLAKKLGYGDLKHPFI